MNFKQEKNKFDSQLLDLINDSIMKIQYFEINYGEPTFDMGEYHSLDYGVSFITGKGIEYYIIWDYQYHQFDIKFSKGNIDKEYSKNARVNSYDLSKHKNWIRIINQPIIKAESIWYDIVEAPGDIILGFENEETVIFSNIENKNKIHGSADHLTVFFKEEIANKYGVNLRIM